jgi:hypothetical protein
MLFEHPVPLEAWTLALAQARASAPQLIPDWAIQLDTAWRTKDPQGIPPHGGGAAALAHAELSGADTLEQAASTGYGCETAMTALRLGGRVPDTVLSYAEHCGMSPFLIEVLVSSAVISFSTAPPEHTYEQLWRALELDGRLPLLRWQKTEDTWNLMLRLLALDTPGWQEQLPQRARSLTELELAQGAPGVVAYLRALALAAELRNGSQPGEPLENVLDFAQQRDIKSDATHFLTQAILSTGDLDSVRIMATRFLQGAWP